jgi:hypothetical protein
MVELQVHKVQKDRKDLKDQWVWQDQKVRRAHKE